MWDKAGKKKNVHVARTPDETDTIRCDEKPVMKSIILELAKQAARASYECSTT